MIWEIIYFTCPLSLLCAGRYARSPNESMEVERLFLMSTSMMNETIFHGHEGASGRGSGPFPHSVCLIHAKFVWYINLLYYSTQMGFVSKKTPWNCLQLLLCQPSAQQQLKEQWLRLSRPSIPWTKHPSYRCPGYARYCTRGNVNTFCVHVMSQSVKMYALIWTSTNSDSIR